MPQAGTTFPTAIIHGPEQKEYLDQNGAINHAIIIRKVIRHISTMPRGIEFKTVACLIRGIALPYIVAVSGHNGSAQDKALDRSQWRDKVCQLAEIMNYHIPKHQYDAPG